MQLTESFIIGVQELTAHKLRSLLTMLGVIFGVAAVVAVVAIGMGARQEALRQVELLGTNNMRVKKLELSGFELAEVRRKSPDGLTRADARAFEEILSEVRRTAARRDFEERIYYDGESPTAGVAAIEPGYLQIIGAKPEQGRLFSPLDDTMAVQRCIIGNNLAKILFALEPPLGKSIQLGRQKYEVVGVMEHRPAGDDEGGKRKSPNLTVYIPMQTGLHRLVALNEPDDLDEIAVQLQPESDLEELKQVMERILKRRHNNVVDYSFVIPELLLKQKQATQRIFSVVLLFIAGLSLLVGGIGIMNIMLATVTQRTKEIGIRRAIGATQNDILVQFLVEALLICLIGGVVGIGVGWGLSQAAQFYAGWSTIINIPAVIVAITVASATGLIFGLYPSLQAAKLDPIEALRHE